MFSLPKASSGMSHAPLHHDTSGTARGTASPKVAKSPCFLRTTQKHLFGPTCCENDRRALCPTAHRFSLTILPNPLTLALTPCSVSRLLTVPHVAYVKEPADVARQPFPRDAHCRPRAQHPRGAGRRHRAATSKAGANRFPRAALCASGLGTPARGGGVLAAPARAGMGGGPEPHH
jgi:hypothetical protein